MGSGFSAYSCTIYTNEGIKLTQVCASSTGDNDLKPSNFTGLDDCTSAFESLSTSDVSHVGSPVPGYTKSEVKQHQSVEDLCNDSNAILLSKHMQAFGVQCQFSIGHWSPRSDH